MKMKRKYRISYEEYCTITNLPCEGRKCPEEFSVYCRFKEIVPIELEEE